MRIRFSGTVPKDEPSTNEDAFFPHGLCATERIALSDGASESYASQKLANLIVEKFVTPSDVADFGINPAQWAENICQAYKEACGDPQHLSWSQQGAFERGSFATLLSLNCTKEVPGGVKICWVGDTCAVLLEDGECRDSRPYKHSDQFQQLPELISTKPSHNSFLHASGFLESHSKWWAVTRKTIILCMTDALAAWAFQCHENNLPVWNELCSLDQARFERIIKIRREKREMRVDDSTLLVIAFDDEASDGVSNP